MPCRLFSRRLPTSNSSASSRAAFLEGDNQVAVPIRLELVCKANGRRIHDLEMHLWTFGPDGLATGFRHFVDTRQWAVATRG